MEFDHISCIAITNRFHEEDCTVIPQIRQFYSLFVQTDTAPQTHQMPMDPIQYQL